MIIFDPGCTFPELSKVLPPAGDAWADVTSCITSSQTFTLTEL